MTDLVKILKNSQPTFSPFLLFLCLSVILFIPSLFNRFALDDYTVILANPNVQSPSHLFANLQNMRVFDTEAGIFRVFSLIFRAVLFALFQDRPLGYHIVNILLNSILCLNIYRLIQRLDPRPNTAMLTAILFCVHPLQSYPVNHIAGHEILLVMIFSVLSLRRYFDLAAYGKRKATVSSAGFYFLALLTQEISIIVPLIIVAVEHLLYRQNWRTVIQRAQWHGMITLIFIVAKVYLFSGSIAFHAQQISATFSLNGLGQHCLAYAQLLGWYLLKTVWPADLVFLINVSAFDPTQATVLTIIFAASLALLFMRFRNTQDNCQKAACAWFLIGLIPVLPLIKIYASAMGFSFEPHWMLIAQIGFFWLLAQVLAGTQTKLGTQSFTALVIAIVIGLSSFAWGYSRLFYDTRTYCAYWLRIVPDNPYAYVYLSKFFKYHNDPGQVIVNTRKALEYGHNEGLYRQMAEAHEKLGQTDAASASLEQAWQHFPDSAKLNNWLGVIAFENSEFDKAAKLFEQAIDSEPGGVSYLHNLANTRMRQSAFDLALEPLNQAIALPVDRKLKRELIAKKAVCFSHLKREDEMAVSVQQYFDSNPAVTEINSFIGLAVSQKQVGLAQLIVAVANSTSPADQKSAQTY